MQAQVEFRCLRCGKLLFVSDRDCEVRVTIICPRCNAQHRIEQNT